MLDRPTLLMCAPDHFEVSYAINPWMHPEEWAANAPALSAKANGQWQGLVAELEMAGFQIELLKPVGGAPDYVFTANAAVVLDGTALIARFRNAERQVEEAPLHQEFATLIEKGVLSKIVTLPDNVILEGMGESIWDRHRKLFWFGWGQRATPNAQGAIEQTFGREVIPLELVDPRFYHIDTALSPLPNGEVLYMPGAFSAKDMGRIREHVGGPNMIPAGEQDAGTLAVNSVALEEKILMSSCSPDLRARLEERGYKVIVVPLDSFNRSGGSTFCLTLRLDHRSS